jgi:Flp pilus assembly protein TadD
MAEQTQHTQGKQPLLPLDQEALQQSALFALRKANALNPDDAETWNNLGHALAQVGRSTEAVVACRKALELEPDYADAHETLGMALSTENGRRPPSAA